LGGDPSGSAVRDARPKVRVDSLDSAIEISVSDHILNLSDLRSFLVRVSVYWRRKINSKHFVDPEDVNQAAVAGEGGNTSENDNIDNVIKKSTNGEHYDDFILKFMKLVT